MARRLLGLAAVAPIAGVALLAAGCGGTLKQPSASNTVLLTKTRPKGTVARIGSLPQAISKASAVALPGGKLMILGGYTGSASVDTILAGAPSGLRVVGHLPQPVHDAAAVFIPNRVYLFGGGSSSSTSAVVDVSPNGKVSAGASMDVTLSDLGAVAIRNIAYLVGGYTGTDFTAAIQHYDTYGGTRVDAVLPHGTRYAGVAAIDRTIYVAGGLTTSGATRNIYSVRGGRVRLIGRLRMPEDHAALAALNGTLYYVGGRTVQAIDPHTGKVTLAAKLPANLSDPTATPVGNAIVIAGGGTNGVWAFRP